METAQRDAVTIALSPTGLKMEADLTRQWVEDTIDGMVDDCNAVKVEMAESLGGFTFHVGCSADDLGKLIGRQGRNARALRCLLTARGRRTNQSFTLNIREARATELVEA